MMADNILGKIRKLNWVLTESSSGTLSYNQLSKILSEVIDANVYITDAGGVVLGTGYINAEDTSTMMDDEAVERIPEYHNNNFMKLTETAANISGDKALSLMGEGYSMAEKYHCILPCVCGGERKGTLIVSRYNSEFGEEDIVLCEYGAAVAALEIQRNAQLVAADEQRHRDAVDMALGTMSFSEREAVQKIFAEFDGMSGILATSKIAEKHGLTNSLVVNALRKLESAGVIATRSMGMKGTRIEIKNDFLREQIKI